MSEKVKNIWKKIKKIPKQRLIRIGIVFVLIIVLMILIIIASESKKEHDRKVSIKEETEKYEIAFENESYTCEEGKEIEVKIKSEKSEFPNDVYVVSSDASIAVVDNNTDFECDNCKKVAVECKKSGNTELKAVHNSETIDTTKLEVSEKEEIIAFEQNSYNCPKGERTEIVVKVTEGMPASIIKSITAEGMIIENISLSETCSNCKIIKVLCRGKLSDWTQSVGSISAETENGKKASAVVTFGKHVGYSIIPLTTENRWRNIYDPIYHILPIGSAYTCKKGEVFWVHFTHDKPECMTSKFSDKCPKLVSWKSENSTIAEISKETWDNDIVGGYMRVGLPANGVNVRVTCNNPGETALCIIDENGYHEWIDLIVDP